MTCIPSSPKDIATVQVGGRTYVFFINKDNRLCYISKANDEQITRFVAQPLEIETGMTIKSDSRQVAAAAWVPKKQPCDTKEPWEIRVYCVGDDNGHGYLQEVCLGSKDKGVWYQGWMGCQRQKDEYDERRYVDEGSSLAAVGTGFESLQVFVSGRGQNGMPKIGVYSYKAEKRDWVEEWIREPLFNV
ncbi:uncharacterized protein B0J16DRAFT_370103 [Fusarium flagelliforme]|uniref:Fucose-specific lectin n=1 Tax=Fusarium flagelliforme TaxID=2675880 RepID=A0A395N3S3_9HYPO|nr:uncharacterized protein B0J16DRAFT_370103 [Fusarium flagelliforme]KAH7188100.1 hypothetical protein B0J16DRAFT_370103 [Fusarium flagelliforme]RFN54537.1 hypothetical protein FIE12Z_1192 [Fusarium flagelliforme]